MSKNRIKVVLPTIASREEAATVMEAIALLTNTKRRLTAQMDARLLAVKEDYSGKLDEVDATLKIESDKLRAWAEANPQEFGKRKSIEFLAGILGFRTGTPKLALLNRAWTWEKVTAAVCEFLPNLVRSKPEVDKEAILGQRDDEAIQAVLPRVGLKVVQDEGFFIEPKLTEPES